MKPLILVGGGGHCKSVIEAATSCGREILGVLERPENVGREIMGFPVVGTDEEISKWAGTAEFVITVGQIKSPTIRVRLDRLIREAGGRLATIVASTAHVSRFAELAEGTVVLHGAMVNAGARIGRNTIINTLANIDHDACIGDFCHISTGAMVNGDVIVGDRVFIGSLSAVMNAARICADCVVAMGTCVRKSLGTAGVYSGNPAKLMQKF